MNIMKNNMVEFSVGLLMFLGLLALAFLALKVSGLSPEHLFGNETYTLKADFSYVGNLKVRAPVRVAGVQVGSVSNIQLNPKTFKARVTMQMSTKIDALPDDTSASIDSVGLLGDNFVSLSPGYSARYLRKDSKISITYPATSFNSLISTFMTGGAKK